MDPSTLPPAPRARILARTQQSIAAVRLATVAADVVDDGEDVGGPVIQTLDPGYIQLFSYFGEPCGPPPLPPTLPLYSSPPLPVTVSNSNPSQLLASALPPTP